MRNLEYWRSLTDEELKNELDELNKEMWEEEDGYRDWLESQFELGIQVEMERKAK